MYIFYLATSVFFSLLSCINMCPLFCYYFQICPVYICVYCSTLFSSLLCILQYVINQWVLFIHYSSLSSLSYKLYICYASECIFQWGSVKQKAWIFSPFYQTGGGGGGLIFFLYPTCLSTPQYVCPPSARCAPYRKRGKCHTFFQSQTHVQTHKQSHVSRQNTA